MKTQATRPITSNDHLLVIFMFCMAILTMLFAPGAQAVQCDRTITANVVVLDSPTVFNRLGAQNPNWMTYALRRDVVPIDPDLPIDDLIGVPGFDELGNPIVTQRRNAQMREDKRPRPLVVRSVAGGCLTVNFQNLLSPAAAPFNAQQDQLFNDDQVFDRCTSFHASGTELIGTMDSDGSFVGNNNPGESVAACTEGQVKAGLVGPGGSITYTLYTPHEGTFVVNSYGATIGGEASSGNLGIGLFGQLNVEPKGARIYRGQLTEEEMRLATVGTVASDCMVGDVVGVDCNPGGQPIIDYEALYPNVEPWISEGKAGLPIINMLTAANELVHSDINAIIAGPNADGSFPPSTYPLESVGKSNPQLPNRLEPFREFASVYHDEQTNSQVFPRWYQNPVLQYTLAGVKDQFMINYGSGGIGSEIIANRLHTGPMHDCTDCAYEEFFLASQIVGDPGMLVNFPANTGIEQCDPTDIAGPTCWRDPINLANGPIPGNFALYQEDPSNVHHAYIGDFVKIRNIHAGAFEQHIFHLHNHQWLFNPNDDNANYLDAQEIMPGSGHTYELANGGSGNRNKTAGDAIFHCHFYPHFAQGMWYHIRNHDVMETGTVLAVSGGSVANPGFHADPFALRSGQPMAGARALPDGELPDGSPIPAIVPLPGKAMPQMPAPVHVVAVDRGSHSILGGRSGPDGIPDSSQAVVDRSVAFGADGIAGTEDDVSPGYPFWLAGNECGIGPANDNCPQGIVGQRMPTPVLDMITEQGAADAGFNPAQAGGWDGGLPRHSLLGYVSGGLSADTNSRLDFRKVIEMAMPVYFPETGTDIEKVNMAFHAVRDRPSAANNMIGTGITAASFTMNGAPPVPGGPYQDPCIDDTGLLLNAGVIGSWFDGDGNPDTLNTLGGSVFSGDNPRTYKMANVQVDAVFNKVGYHYPQERIITLWEDVEPTILKQRPPEPLVMRFNSFDCGKILHTNLVPHEYELDDFQVRTPTDIIGQHIHLPKWDLTTGDGAANGWNYEDGALAPGIVQERIHAINEFNALAGTLVPAGTLPGQLAPIDLTDMVAVATIDTGDSGGTPAGLTHLSAQPHPFFGAGKAGQDHLGARTVIQRILIDPVVNVAGVDRGLGLTFTHDHYGPSTFQQIGLYATILAEPAGSTWMHNESGVELYTRDDGGPTTWQAAILPPAAAPGGSNVGAENIPDHREFYFEMSDFQHAYEAGTYVGADANGVPILTNIIQPDPFNATKADAPALFNTWQQTVNPPLKLKSVPFPDVVTAEAGCPGPLGNFDPNITRPCAEAINISHSSMFVVNYRNEPVGLRVFDPNAIGPDGNNGSQAAGPGGDLAFALQSRQDRAIPELNTSLGNTPYPTPGYCKGSGDGINCDRRPGDPFTPIMRAYERDQIKVKIQVGATEEQHQTTIHGLKWLSNGSGFGRSPNSGWRNFQSHGISEQFSLQLPLNPDLQQAGNTVDYLYSQDATRDGMWLGTWGVLRSYGNVQKDLFELPDNPQKGKVKIVNAKDFTGVCPKAANLVEYDVTAVLANDVLPNNLGVIIPANLAGDSDGDGIGDNVGGPLNPLGGTLVYNRRGTNVPSVIVVEPGLPAQIFQGGDGPLNDPTAMMYVRTGDLINLVERDAPAACFDNGGNFDPVGTACGINLTGCLDPAGDFDGNMASCPVALRDTAPVEPLVLRANAGDCIEVTLRNRLLNQAAVTIAGGLPVVDADGDPVFVDKGAEDNELFVLDPLGVSLCGGQLCTAVALADVVFDAVPDLAGWQDMMWIVKRNIQVDPVTGLPEMHFFNNNLIRPSSYVGLHPQLVEYDVSRHEGVVVGQNNPSTLTEPGDAATTLRWYAGDLTHKRVAGKGKDRNFEIVATPVEFGGVNLVSADRIKQPQKGLFGALVIEPAGAVVTEDTQVPDGQGTLSATRLTRAQVTVDAGPLGAAGDGGTYREALAIGHKITNLRWKDGSAIANVNQGELGREGAEDSGHAGFNYGMEPSWFRFQLPPDVPFGNHGTPDSFGSLVNAHAMYANQLVANLDHPNFIPDIPGVSAAGDPQTPVFNATANQATRMHVLNGASADRDGTFILHGHLWQRDPYVCPGQSDLGLIGRCNPDEPVPSQALGLNPQGKYMGGEEGMGHVFGHWPILFDAGGTDGVSGDYLFRDYAPNGNRNGQFGLLRVAQ